MVLPSSYKLAMEVVKTLQIGHGGCQKKLPSQSAIDDLWRHWNGLSQIIAGNSGYILQEHAKSGYILQEHAKSGYILQEHAKESDT